MHKASMLAAALGILGSSAACSTPAEARTRAANDEGAITEATPTKTDTDFFNDATQGGLLEVRLAQLALQKSSNEEVKKFAQRMIDDHGKLNSRLTQISQVRRSFIMPTDLDTKHRKIVDDMAKETGSKFDRDYMGRMVDDHQDDVKAFEKETKDGADTDLKSAANEALPIIRDHLNQAKQIYERVKK
jgi:putative membrane protein